VSSGIGLYHLNFHNYFSNSLNSLNSIQTAPRRPLHLSACPTPIDQSRPVPVYQPLTVVTLDAPLGKFQSLGYKVDKEPQKKDPRRVKPQRERGVDRIVTRQSAPMAAGVETEIVPRQSVDQISKIKRIKNKFLKIFKVVKNGEMPQLVPVTPSPSMVTLREVGFWKKIGKMFKSGK